MPAQAKLHIALELNNGAADQGYTVSQGPPATANHTERRAAAAAGAEVEMAAGCRQVGAGLGGDRPDDPRLQHAAAQVKPDGIAAVAGL